MKELNSIEARFRKDLGLITRDRSKLPPQKSVNPDQVELGQRQAAQEKGDGLVQTGQTASNETVQAILWEPPAATQTVSELAPGAPHEVAKPEGGSGQSFSSVLGSVVSSILGTPRARLAKELKEINKLEQGVKGLKTPADFAAKKADFVKRIKAGESLEKIRPEAIAVARQAISVAQGKRPHDCQVSGAVAMCDGQIAEMKTGEGKTLTAVMPLYLNALAGKGAHLVTVNDTLAFNGAQENRSTFDLLGMSVGCALEGMDADQKREAYKADVTYVSNHTLGFDFLRDQTAKHPRDRVQREPFYALVDEADEVFLDEAQTPLIISGKTRKVEGEYQTFHQLVGRMKKGDDFRADPDRNTVWPTETGLEWAQTQLQVQELDKKLATSKDPAEQLNIRREMAQVEGLAHSIRLEQAAERALEADGLSPTEKAARQASYDKAVAQKKELAESTSTYELYAEENAHRARFLENALKARVLFRRDKDYLVDEGGVQIVDPKKGRASEGRRFSSGLHQALEVKEGVEVNPELQTTASITYPNLFKRYPRRAGMSGTALSSAAELYELYKLETVRIDTNKPVARVDEPDTVFKTEEEKFAALARDAAQDFFEGKPVLIGTLSVKQNHYMLQQLLKQGVPEDSLQVLNAESVKGNKEAENEMIQDAGRSGVITVATNLAGRGANIKPDLINFKKVSMDVSQAVEKGKPVVIELEKGEDARWLGQWLGGYEPTIIDKSSRHLPRAGEVTIRVGKGGLAPADGVLLNADAPKYQTGGLTVYGTERAESRRIDDQLIGRAGRQGAPGRSKFYLSLEDNLFQKYGGTGLPALQRLFTEPGKGLSGKMFSKLIDAAQQNAEGAHAQMRQHTTNHDQVLDQQRDNFFGLRDEIVESGDEVRQQVSRMAANAVADAVLDELPDKKTFTHAQIGEAVKKAEKTLGTPLPLAFLDPKLKTPPKTKMKAKDLESELLDLGHSTASKALKAQPDDESVRAGLLEVVDDTWSGHLEEMEGLKASSQWQTLAQQDPEVFFKIESANVFAQTLRLVDRGAWKMVQGAVAPSGTPQQ